MAKPLWVLSSLSLSGSEGPSHLVTLASRVPEASLFLVMFTVYDERGLLAQGPQQ